MAESDGIEEAISHNLREALQTAEQTGRNAAQAIARAQAMRQQRAEEHARDQRERARYDTAWSLAQEKLGVVDDPQWWDSATPDQVAEVYEIAVTWRDHENAAGLADNVIYAEVLERYGHDLRSYSREQVRDDLEKVEARQKVEKPEQEITSPETQSLDNAPVTEPAAPKDDAEQHREQAPVKSHQADVDPELNKTRRKADMMNGRHPSDATEQKHASPRLHGPRSMPKRARQTEHSADR